MPLVMAYQSEPGGSYTIFDPGSFGICQMSLTFSDSSAASLRFDLIASQETMPIGLRWFVKVWDPAGETPDGAAQSFDNPLFEGHVREIQPADSNLLKYVCFDASLLAGADIAVMSTAWLASPGAGLMPVPDSEAVPRIIFNNAISNDVDYAFSRADGLTVGQIISQVLTDAVYPLHWFNAAPSPVGTSAFINLEMGQFVHKPQEKIVFTNQSIRAALDSMTQQYYPEFAFLWTPGTRLWHWYSRLNSPTETVTLNRPGMTLSSGTETTVLSMELHRSIEGCYPAVMFYGPETAGPVEIFGTSDGTLVPVGDFTVLENYIDSGGIGTSIAYSVYQISDAEKRRGARFFPTTFQIRENDEFMVGTRSPRFECTFDDSSWQGIESVWFDWQNGMVIIPDGLFVYKWYEKEIEFGSTRHFWTPINFRLTWAPYTEPLSVRFPTTGFSGTSYSVAGQTSELRIYDEMLAVGYNRVGLPVTTATRVNQYLLLAQSLHRAKKDIKYTGGMLLDGLIYDFCRLNKCVNIAAVDEDGDTITTGWEGIRAVASEVVFNFDDQTTHITFSQDALEQWGENVDLLKQRLRIGAVEKIRVMKAFMQYSTGESKYNNKSGKYNYGSGVVWSDYDLYYDSNTGQIDNALGGPQYDTRDISSNIDSGGLGVVTDPTYDPWTNTYNNPAMLDYNDKLPTSQFSPEDQQAIAEARALQQQGWQQPQGLGGGPNVDVGAQPIPEINKDPFGVNQPLPPPIPPQGGK